MKDTYFNLNKFADLMKKMSCYYFPLIFVLVSFSCSKMERVEELRCEHLVNPLGIDCPSPRLSWLLPADGRVSSQTAYRILVDTDSVRLSKGEAHSWDSGKTCSDSVLVAYKGESLTSFTRYFWKVICWDEKGKEATSDIASFETGMLNMVDWEGEWISDGKDVHYKPAPYFRKAIQLNKKVKSARAYIAVAGFYELYFNGVKAGDRLLDPMYTRYDRRNLYTTYDVTPLLNEGENAIGVILGNSWYNHQSTAVWFFDKAEWRNRPRFLLNVHVNYDDGTRDVFVSDGSWRTHDSPIVFNSIYTAEHYDARKELPGWNKAGFDETTWSEAVVEQAPSANITAQQLEPVRVTEVLSPVFVDKKSDAHYVFHFSKNIAGIIKLKVKGERGTEIRIKHGEMLYADGTVNMENIDYHYRPTADKDPFQTDILYLSGGDDCFSPKFNYKGFQYVEIISDKAIELSGDDIRALELHSDVKPAGSIHSSNETLNKIWQATNNAYLSNLFGYPTDCPQREKNGWTGDGHIAIETGLYNFDAITVYEKWLNDFKDEQKDNGVLPCIIPTSVWGYDWANGVDWTCAVALIPWEVYQFYGDSRLLFNMYDNIKRYVDYIESISPDGLTDWGLGDWIPVRTTSNKELTTSIYYYVVTDILAKSAVLFDRNSDALYYKALSEKIKNAINDKYLDTETGIYADGTQTEQAMALYWGIVPNEAKDKVACRLYEKVEEAGFHLDVGLLGSKALLNALSENGYADAAYKVASQETYPSWGYWVVNGATTLYENWRIDVVIDASLNHIMFGEIGAWLYKGLGGIFPDEAKPGFKNIILKPNFVDGLDAFEAKHKSPYGWIVSTWEKNKDKVVYTIEVPSNSTAVLYPPQDVNEADSVLLKSGKHVFTFTKK